MPNRAKSKAQFRMLQAVAHGSATRRPTGLSADKAAEMLGDQSPEGLPERVKIEPKRNSYRPKKARGW